MLEACIKNPRDGSYQAFLDCQTQILAQRVIINYESSASA